LAFIQYHIFALLGKTSKSVFRIIAITVSNVLHLKETYFYTQSLLLLPWNDMAVVGNTLPTLKFFHVKSNSKRNEGGSIDTKPSAVIESLTRMSQSVKAA
jgi:hypothetical protein